MVPSIDSISSFRSKARHQSLLFSLELMARARVFYCLTLSGLCTKASNHKPVTTRLVRRHLWMSPGGFSMSRRDSDSEKVPAALYDRLTDTPTYAARMYKVQLVNGLLSAQAIAFPDSPEVGIGKVFKVRSNGYIKNGTEGYFARVDFEQGLHIGEIRTRRLKQDYQIAPEEFSPQDARDAWGLIKGTENDHLFSNISTNNDMKVRQLFSNNCIQYFPHNRYEEPAWLNEADLTSQAELLLPAHVHGSTIRKVISYSPLKENQNWLFGVLFDRSVFETQTVNVPMPVQGSGQSVPLPVLN